MDLPTILVEFWRIDFFSFCVLFEAKEPRQKKGIALRADWIVTLVGALRNTNSFDPALNP